MNRLQRAHLYGGSKRGGAAVARARATSAVVETLEGRQLMSTTAPAVHGGILAVLGTNRADDIRVSMDPNGTGKLAVSVNGKQYTFAKKGVREIHVDGRGGNDFIGAEPTFGQVRIPMTFIGGGGRDTLVGGAAKDSLDGGNGADVVLGRAGKDALDGGKGADWLDGGGGRDVVNAAAGRDTVVQAAGKDKVTAPRTTTVLRTPQADPARMPWDNTQPVIEAGGDGSTTSTSDNGGGLTSSNTAPQTPSPVLVDQDAGNTDAPTGGNDNTTPPPTDNNTSTDPTNNGTTNEPTGIDVGTPEPVPIYDATLFTGRPSLTPFGLKATRLQDVSHFLEADNWTVVESKVRAEADIAASQGAILIIDQETWPLDIRKAPVDQVTAAVQKMVQIVDLVHAEQPGLKVGYYGALPMPDYWTPVLYQQYLQSNPSYAQQVWLPKYQAWQAANDMLKPVGDVVDFVCPSLYTFYDSPDSWTVYAQANIAEGKRYGKPVLPFLWMQYHDSNPTLKGQFLPADVWKSEIDQARAISDGVVVWGGWQQPWDPNAAWWQVVQDEVNQTSAAPATLVTK